MKSLREINESCGLFPGFSEEELEEARAAVQDAGLCIPEDFDTAVSICSLEPLRSQDEFLQERINEADRIKAIFKELDQLLKPWTETEVRGDDGAWEIEPRGKKYTQIRPALEDIVTEFVAEALIFEAVLTNLPPVKNSEKPLQQSLHAYIASLWTELGGELDYGHEYRRFFEAIAGPIYTSNFGRLQGLRWTSETFRNHVKTAKRSAKLG